MTTRTAARRPGVPGVASAAGRGLVLLAVMGAVPWALVTLAPLPLPGSGRLQAIAEAWASDPSSEAASTVSRAGRLLQQTITDQLIVQLLALAVWLIWAAFLLCLIAEAISLASGIPAPRLPGLGGMQSAASWLLTGTLAGLLASSAMASQPAPAQLSPAASVTSAASLTAVHTSTVRTSSGRLVYVVQTGDWLGAIAHRFLGDYDAYGQLRGANRDLIPDTAGPRGPDHIEPGWHLHLPVRARDRGPEDHATGHTLTSHLDPADPADAAASSVGEPSGKTSPPAVGETPEPGNGPAPTSTAAPSAESAPPAADTSLPSTPATTHPAAQPAPEPATAGEATPSSGGAARPDGGNHEDGARVGEGWISWPLAASLVAAASLVWLARRRLHRYTEPFSYPEDLAGGDPSGAADPDGMSDLHDSGEPVFRPGADEADTGADAEGTPLDWPIHSRSTTGRSSSDPEANPGPHADLDGGRDVLAESGPDDRPATAWRRRRTARPVQFADDELDDDADLRPMPAVLNRIRMLVRAHGDELAGPRVAPHPQRFPAVGGSPRLGVRQEDPDAESVARDLPAFSHTHLAPGPAAENLPPVGPSGAQLAGLCDIPAEGIGLAGAGAAGAARALLVAALSAGGPADPDAAGTVVTTLDTLNALIGSAAAVNAEGLPRLQIAPDLDSALSILDEHILSRRRTLDVHEESDPLRLREEQPWSAPMPPVLLLVHAPHASAAPIKSRLSTTLHLGGPLQICGVLLGDWARGRTRTLDPSGRDQYRGAAGQPPASQAETRLAVLGATDTIDLLAVLGEAHTGHPIMTTPSALDSTSAAGSAPAAAGAPSEPAPIEPDPSEPGPIEPGPLEPGPAPHAPQEPATAEPDVLPPRTPSPQMPSSPDQERIRMRVLGAPMILDRDGHPVPGLRSGAIQLLAILSVHREGHPLMDIMEKMWPDARTRKAADRLSTEAANLRRTVRIALGRPEDRTPATNAVINTGSYYILNENLLDIDLWQLQDHVSTAKDTADPSHRIGLLRAAIAAHTGPLADGRDYPWADVARHQVQRHGIRARLHLAQLLAGQDPAEAARIITEAADLDPVSEDLAQRAIRACAAAGNAGGVRARLRALRAALDEIDQEPTGETLALATNIRVAREAGSANAVVSHRDGKDWE